VKLAASTREGDQQAVQTINHNNNNSKNTQISNYKHNIIATQTYLIKLSLALDYGGKIE